MLTGAIRTGKTTALLHWANARNDGDGLLCPDDEAGKRYFLKVKCKEEIALEVEVDSEVSEEKIIEIGSFKFLKSAFIAANDYLLSIASETENRFLIIDEIGKLELKKEGLHRSAEALVSRFKNDNSQHLILVVRDYLLDAVLEHYAITEYSLLEKEDLKWFE